MNKTGFNYFSILVCLLCLTKCVISTEDILKKLKIDGELCSKTSEAKGILQVAETLSVALKQIISSAQQKYQSVEKNVCSLTSDEFTPTPENSDCQSAPQDCAAIQTELHFKTSGIYRIWPRYLNHSVMVYCDMETENGGWTVFQRRTDEFPSQKTDFYRNYEDYKNGFGNLTGEFWLGNDAIFALTNQDKTMMRVDLEDFEGNQRYAVYNDFSIGSTITNYKLNIDGYSGDATDSLIATHNGHIFSTYDLEGDVGMCANRYKGGWWYAHCHVSNLNGLYLRGNHSTFADGVNWHSWKGYHYSLRKTEMKIRPKSF